MSDTPASLADLLEATPDFVSHLYNDTLSTHPRARSGVSPVPLEATNWIDEQRAWRNSAVLFDQSHHMPELFIKGPDAVKLLSRVGVNSFENIGPGRAKQFVGCNPQGFIIGECVLYCHDTDDFELVSGFPLLSWVEYNAKLGKYDVTLTRDNHTGQNAAGRVKYRFQVDGPNAGNIFSEAIEGELPDIKFFWHAQVKIAGCNVTVLRHGMSGHRGVELSGPYEDGPKVRKALLDVGRKYDLVPGGNLAYFSTVIEGGWMGSGFPAIFTSPELQSYRESLASDSWEANAQLGGSFLSKNIEDYYSTPWDHDLQGRIAFDHDFIGREALEKAFDKPHRVRRTLVWNKEDVVKVFASLLEPGPAYKLLRLPYAHYGYYHFDSVSTAGGELVGLGVKCGYSANETDVLTLAKIDERHAEIGNELVITWGEPNGGSRKPQVERHRQAQIRATVAPAPYAKRVSEIKHKKLQAAV